MINGQRLHGLSKFAAWLANLGLFLLIILGTSMTSRAQMRGPELYLDICRFNSPISGRPLLEIHLAVAGRSLQFKKESDGKFQAKVHIDYSLKYVAGQDTSEFLRDDFNLVFPEALRLTDTTLSSKKRANLLEVVTPEPPEGKYLLVATAVDSNSLELAKSMAISEFELKPLPIRGLAFSDVKWVAGEIPGGAEKGTVRERIVPLVTNNTFFNEDTLAYYLEIYNPHKLFSDYFYIRSVLYQGDNRLYQYETRKQARSIREMAQGTSINVQRESIRINGLRTNTYHLQVELINKQDQIVRTFRKKFYVINTRISNDYDLSNASSNPETALFDRYAEDTLDYFLRTLRFKTNDTRERRLIEALETYEMKKNFLYSFFDRRRKSGQTVRMLWNSHLAALRIVNERFGTKFMRGWQTDRGRAFLAYGPPNDVQRYPAESSVIPYEIWRYNRIDPQTNVIFIFYDPNGTSAWELLHSNKIGEINNPRWRQQLLNQGTPPANVDFEDDNDLQYTPKLNPRNN